VQDVNRRPGRVEVDAERLPAVLEDTLDVANALDTVEEDELRGGGRRSSQSNERKRATEGQEEMDAQRDRLRSSG
jgi:hypothetical protein